MENDKNSIFFIDPKEGAKLGIESKQNMEKNIINIFMVAKIQERKDELTLDEITIAYHNLITTQIPNGKIKTKKDIAQKLFMMRGGGKNSNVGDIELVPGKRGVYRLKKGH